MPKCCYKEGCVPSPLYWGHSGYSRPDPVFHNTWFHCWLLADSPWPCLSFKVCFHDALWSSWIHQNAFRLMQWSSNISKTYANCSGWTRVEKLFCLHWRYFGLSSDSGRSCPWPLTDFWATKESTSATEAPPPKCEFLQLEVKYLGYTLSGSGLAPNNSKVEKVQKFPVPVDVTTVRQFLGLASYYRQFIPGFSKIAEPLNALLKKDVYFQWTSECQSSFTELKSLLTTTPVGVS